MRGDGESHREARGETGAATLVGFGAIGSWRPIYSIFGEPAAGGLAADQNQ